jgi:hypothetical protein
MKKINFDIAGKSIFLGIWICWLYKFYNKSIFINHEYKNKKNKNT